MIQLHLYLLELADEKYYVGQSNRPEVRFSDHQIGQGGKWTRLYEPIAILKTKNMEVEDLREAILYENWMTLCYMEKYGWQNVRGGDFLEIEDYRIAEKIRHIYDTESNKIKYYLPDCPYLFGASRYWLIYILELENGRYYIGSGKRLGKMLGGHFCGTSIAFTRQNKPIRVIEFHVLKPNDEPYLEVKRKLLRQYTDRYGQANVLGGNLE